MGEAGLGRGRLLRDGARRCRGWGRAERAPQVAARAGVWGGWGPQPGLPAPVDFTAPDSGIFSPHPVWKLRMVHPGSVYFLFASERGSAGNKRPLIRTARFPCSWLPLASPHPFWVTDNPASLCKATWEDLSRCIPGIDRCLLI